MPEPSEMSDSLLRQRRNLIVTSLIVIFILYTKVTITKINFFGIEIDTPEPHSLMTVLWVIWVYFLIRFYQYSRVEPSTGAKYEFNTKLNSLGSRVILERIVEKHPEIKANIGDCSVWNLQKVSFLRWELPVTQYEPTKGEKIEIYKEPIGVIVMFVPVVKAAWHTLAHTPRVTDYVFPYLLALAAVIYGIINAINI